MQALAQQDFPYVFVEYDSAWTFQNLKLIPIRFKGDGKGVRVDEFNNLITLSQAMQSSRFSLTEVKKGDGADVNVLQIKNRTRNSVIIHTGELISGGKQDRIAAETIVIPASKDEQFINVFCVEKGRWDKKASRFLYDGAGDAELRKIVDTKRQQHEVWKAINELYKKQELESVTWTYRNVNNAKRRVADTAYYHYFNKRFALSDSSYAGFIAITGNRIIVCDLYCHEVLTQIHFSNLLSGYVRAAVENGDKPSLPALAIEEFMTPILSDNKTRDAFLEKYGRAFKHQGRIIHISAYGD